MNENRDEDREGETLTCRDCGQTFLFSVGEQEFFKSKGFQNKPSRCKICKAALKRGRAGNDGDRDGRGRDRGYKNVQNRQSNWEKERKRLRENAPLSSVPVWAPLDVEISGYESDSDAAGSESLPQVHSADDRMAASDCN